MSRAYHLLIFIAFLYLFWRCLYSQQLLATCEEFQSIRGNRDIVHVVRTAEQPRPPNITPVHHCVGEQMPACIPALIPFRQQYRVSDKYRLIGCAIEKNFSTVLTAIFCYLFDEQSFLQSGRNFTSEAYHRRFCAKRNEYTSLSEIESKFTKAVRDWKMIAVVRDPLDRFVSGFVDKCIREKTWMKFPYRCNRCKTNLKCFMERQYARMKKKASGANQPPNFDDDHFFPQNWRCEFKTHLHAFQILHFDNSNPSTFLNKLLAIFKKNNVPNNSTEFIKSSVEAGQTPHSTRNSVEHSETKRQILSNPHLLNLLIQMYFFDYTLFGYPIPVVQKATNIR